MKPVPAKTCPSCGDRYEGDVLFCPKDGTPLASAQRATLTAATEGDPYVGLELAGQIRIDHLIGIGSMGRVYRAFQAGIDRDVAVKILHRELSGNPELVARFHREAKVASRLVHANVVQVLMTGALPQVADPRVGGELYLVMEHLDGLSLASALAAAGDALPLPRALHIALQICDAVGEAHAQGIVHRDLKPENVMLVPRGDDRDYVKVLDFGIARLDWADRGLATQAGLIFGTAKYISPEGAEGQSVGPAADVYSIGTILYQCLAGRTPFEGDSPVALLVQHTHAPPPDLRSIARASYVPQPIATVVMAALAKRPGDRPANARLLGRDLVAAVRASGLDPEEIVPHSPLLASGGVVKLASRERTKSLDLTPDLAARIGAARSNAPPEVAFEAASSAPPAARSSRPVGTRTEITDAPMLDAPPAAATVEPTLDDDDVPPPAAGASARPSRAARAPSSRAPAPRGAAPPELDFDDARGGQASTTMQGTESPASRAVEPPRRRALRVAVLAVAVALAALLVVLGGRRDGGSGQAASGDTIEARLEAARDCMRRHAWDAPARQNVREILADVGARWPADARVADLRHEAAQRLVSDALGRKYAGNAGDALHLAHLALELNPDSTTAQHLVADLERAQTPPEVAPAPDAGPVEAHGTLRPPPRRWPGGPAPRPVEPPSAGHPTATSAPTAGAAVLPPSPPPLPTDQALPAPSSTGPWL
jgi:serine/threonine-protein kinase